MTIEGEVMLHYHKRVDVDGDGTLNTIVESSTEPAYIIDETTKEKIYYYSVRYAEGPYDIVRDSGGELISMGLRDNNAFVGEPEIGNALRSAKELPYVFPIISFTDVLIVRIKTPEGVRTARIYLRPWNGRTWMKDCISEPQPEEKMLIDAQ
jgi:hypothetical protein